MCLLRNTIIAIFASAMFSHASLADDWVYTGKPAEFDNYGYMVREAAWKFEGDKPHSIPVCWENPNPSNQDARDWVKDQITKTWQLHSSLTFEFWGPCIPTNKGIRILWSDEGARVKKFGRHIDGEPAGMILNYTFKNWNELCQTTLESCVRSIAVHEFGHAIGFAHEQNRPDTPGECSIRHGQGQTKEIMLTTYDPHSVMNYCNDVYNNDGLLSALDIKSVQMVYGPRS